MSDLMKKKKKSYSEIEKKILYLNFLVCGWYRLPVGL